MKYDYIIAGSGCAGLSLLYRMLQDPVLGSKKILVIDKEQKKENDRTWCYWEKEEGLFEPIVTQEWKKLEFLTEEFTREMELQEYSYKMIRGVDFYSFVLSSAKKMENISFKYETIKEISESNSTAFLTTEKERYEADFIFNSTSLFNPEMSPANSLLQHFEGWFIKAKKPSFDPSVGKLMDFRIPQKNGATFMYVLPTSTTEALIEYTLFSEKLLDKEEYKQALKNYITDYLNIEEYEITHAEFGVIPMSLTKFNRNPNSQKRILNIGTAGGFTKASSGYTFQFIQKNSKSIVDKLISQKTLSHKITRTEKIFGWYDRTLLEVILSGKMETKEIFSILFKNLPPEDILAFLGNESSFLQELKLMNSLPKIPFIKAGIKQLY